VNRKERFAAKRGMRGLYVSGRQGRRRYPLVECGPDACRLQGDRGRVLRQFGNGGLVHIEQVQAEIGEMLATRSRRGQDRRVASADF
jgi:hypothetical protein